MIWQRDELKTEEFEVRWISLARVKVYTQAGKMMKRF